MATSRVVLCPGQGAQSVGMGRAWFESSSVAAEVFARADRVVGSRLGGGMTLSELCFNGPGDTLNRTDAAQPAIFTASVACFRALEANGTVTVAAFAGLSLGEYTALHLSGAIEFEAALELVVLRGRAMQDAAEASKGSMVALIGADEAQAEAVCAEAARGGGEGEVLVCANFNAPGQIVLSGHASACDRAVQVAETMGLKATRLQVAGAFHSPLMAPAAERLQAALVKTPIKAGDVPVVSNVTARPHEEGPGGPDQMRARLVQQLTMPVRWAQSCAWKVSAYPSASFEYHELAPGKVLSGLMRRIDRGTKVVNHDEPAAAPA
ncbi:MAG: ACP S-malonyltransferase [Phycisphaerales bacterium]